jgi:hypothetical protein
VGAWERGGVGERSILSIYFILRAPVPRAPHLNSTTPIINLISAQSHSPDE